jgi:hypothetical protein
MSKRPLLDTVLYLAIAFAAGVGLVSGFVPP